MAGKTTSAGYRLPMATSGYHEKCIAASVKAIKDVSDKTSDKHMTKHTLMERTGTAMSWHRREYGASMFRGSTSRQRHGRLVINV